MKQLILLAMLLTVSLQSHAEEEKFVTVANSCVGSFYREDVGGIEEGTLELDMQNGQILFRANYDQKLRLFKGVFSVVSGEKGWVDQLGRTNDASVTAVSNRGSLVITRLGYDRLQKNHGALIDFTIDGTKYVGTFKCKLTQ